MRVKPHLDLVRNINTKLTNINLKGQVLIADLEINDQEILSKIKESKDTFYSKMIKSKTAIERLVEDYGLDFEVCLMSERYPDIAEKISIAKAEFRSPKYEDQIRYDTLERLSRYRMINPCATDDQLMERTRQAAAEFLALGQLMLVDNQNPIVINHSTSNLVYYTQNNVPFIENPLKA